MKKMIIAGVALIAAFAVNAATVNWKTGTNIKGPTADGSFGSDNLAKGAFTFYVWDTLTAAEYNDLAIDKIYDTYSTQKSSAISGGVASGSPTLGTTAKNASAADGTTYYAAILMTYTDTTGKEWYIANKATATTDAAGAGATVNNLAKNIGGTGDAISGWSTAVPEPTSGLLLLLGMAGLALKRKLA